MIFSSFAEAISSMFYANEQMVSAAISSVTTILRVMLGALALLVGWGVVGLAGVSAVVNVIHGNLGSAGGAVLLLRPRMELEPAFGRKPIHLVPMMINHLLATVFFRADIQFLSTTAAMQKWLLPAAHSGLARCGSARPSRLPSPACRAAGQRAIRSCAPSVAAAPHLHPARHGHHTVHLARTDCAARRLQLPAAVHDRAATAHPVAASGSSTQLHNTSHRD
jgi:hypothetical protein